ncbi:hypothetical protein KKH42_02525 [bacterium]|nr:hypothetical protein [bacterium]
MKKPKKRMTLHEKAMCAMEAAVKKVMAEHKKAGRPVAIWVDGKVKMELVK